MGQITSPITLLVRNHIDPLLTEHGFSYRKQTWNREVDNVTHAIEIRPGRFNSPEEQDLGLYVGLYVRGVDSTYTGSREPTWITVPHCCPAFLARDLPVPHPPTDRALWSLRSVEDVEAVGEDLVTVLNNACIPFLNLIKTPHDVIRLLDAKPPRVLPDRVRYAIMLALCGNDREASAALDTIESESPDATWDDVIARVRALVS